MRALWDCKSYLNIPSLSLSLSSSLPLPPPPFLFAHHALTLSPLLFAHFPLILDAACVSAYFPCVRAHQRICKKCCALADAKPWARRCSPEKTLRYATESARSTIVTTIELHFIEGLFFPLPVSLFCHQFIFFFYSWMMICEKRCSWARMTVRLYLDVCFWTFQRIMTVRIIPSFQTCSFLLQVERKGKKNEREIFSPRLLFAQTCGSRVQGRWRTRAARWIRNDRRLQRFQRGGERVRRDPAHGGHMSGLLRRDGSVGRPVCLQNGHLSVLLRHLWLPLLLLLQTLAAGPEHLY